LESKVLDTIVIVRIPIPPDQPATIIPPGGGEPVLQSVPPEIVRQITSATRCARFHAELVNGVWVIGEKLPEDDV
jgi:hypothetical protein